jgi:hypothetical protein
LNFSNSPFIRHLYLTGSGVSSLTLPPNGVLSTLRLPSSIIDLHIEGHGGLTDDNFSLGYYDYGTGSRIEEKDENGNLLGRYVNDFTQVQKVFV